MQEMAFKPSLLFIINMDKQELSTLLDEMLAEQDVHPSVIIEESEIIDVQSLEEIGAHIIEVESEIINNDESNT